MSNKIEMPPFLVTIEVIDESSLLTSISPEAKEEYYNKVVERLEREGTKTPVPNEPKPRGETT